MSILPQMAVPEMVAELLRRYAGTQAPGAPAPGGGPADATPMDLNGIIAAAAGKSPVTDARPEEGASPTPGAPPPLGPVRDIPERRMAPMAAPAPAEAPPDPAPRPAAPIPTLSLPAEPRDRSFLSQVGSVLRGLGSSNALLPAIGGAIGGVESDNATFRALTAKGLSDDMAKAAMSNPMFMASALSPKTQVINNRIVESATGRVIADLSDTATKGPDVKDFYLPNGDKVSGVYSATRKRYELPDGSPIPAGGTPAGDVPPGMDGKVYRKTMSEELAKSKATSIAALPEARRSARFITERLDEVIADNDLGKVTGMPNGHLPNWSEAANKAQSKVDQLKGSAFLQAYQALRGAGAISNTEGAKAESALARLNNQKVGTAAFREAAAEFRSEVMAMLDVAERKARGDYAPSAADTPISAKPPEVKVEPVKNESDARMRMGQAIEALKAGKDRGEVERMLKAMGLPMPAGY